MSKPMKKNNGQQPKKKTVKLPLAVSQITRNAAPSFKTSKNGIVISHREFVTDVTTSSTVNDFNTIFREINPGLTQSFPWLSGIAPNFESYRFLTLSFEYVPFCASTTVGSVMMGVDWDVSDYEPASKSQMLAYQTVVSGPMWEPSVLKCEPANLRKFSLDHFVRVLDPGQVDLKTYDVGCLYVSTSNNAVASQSIGSVFVNYTVELLTPQIQADDPYRASAKLYTTTCSKAAPLDGVVLTQDAYEPLAQLRSGQQVDFVRPGQYLLETGVTGTGLNTTYPDVQLTDADAGGFYTIETIANAAATAGYYMWILDLLKPSTMTFTSPAAWTTVSALKLRMAPYKVTNL